MDKRLTNTKPIVTYLIISAVTIVQLCIFSLPTNEAVKVYDAYALFPVRLFNGVGVEGLATYLFLHSSWIHVIVNIIALLGTGGIVEREVGSTIYALVYLSSGIVAGLVHCILHTSSEIPLVGASGAIFGVIAILFLLMPFKITLTLIMPLPSVLVGIILSAIEFSAVWLSTDAIVAHDAHLGGFVFGCLCAFAIDKRRAIRGLIIAASVFAILYCLGIYFKLI